MNELATRQTSDIRHEWLSLFEEILRDLARTPGPEIDDFEQKAIAHTLKPLAQRILSGELSPSASTVWRFRFTIRNCKFRPTYDELTVFLNAALGIEEVVGHVAQERTVVTAPKPRQIEGSNTARDRARQKLTELIARTGMHGTKTSHGPEVWRPAYPNRPDPLENVPEEMHPSLIEAAIQELMKTGKGRHPNQIRTVAGKIYRDSQRKPPPPPGPMTEEQYREMREQTDRNDDIPAFMLGVGNEWGKS